MIENHQFNDEMYLILNKDGTEFRKEKKKCKAMIYHLPKNFINNEKYKNCKVAIFELKEIIPIDKMKK